MDNSKRADQQRRAWEFNRRYMVGTKVVVEDIGETRTLGIAWVPPTSDMAIIDITVHPSPENWGSQRVPLTSVAVVSKGEPLGYENGKAVFDTIEQLRDEANQKEEEHLRKSGWRATSSTPGSYWMWCREIAGQRVLVDRASALRMQRIWDNEEHANAHPEQYRD